MATPSHIESCTQCLSKYERTRTSLCRCHHCSKSFCFDCMKEHHEELQEKITHLSHRYNELHALYQTKQQMIDIEVKKASGDVEVWFNQLIEMKKSIMENIEQASKNGQDRLSEMLTKLQEISRQINGLAKETLFDPEQIPSLVTNLDDIENNLKIIIVKKRTKLPEITLNYEFSFEDASQNNIPLVEELSQSCGDEKLGRSNQKIESDRGSTACHSSLSADSVTDCIVPTSYAIDCMASDGINIMYNTYDTTPPSIACCNLNNFEVADHSRLWYQSRIIDMIYWKSIEKFICATNGNVYTVEYENPTFKIITAVRDTTWFDIRVAANDTSLWIWSNPGKRGYDKINVYSTLFQLIRTIEFGRAIPDAFRRGISFSVTQDCVASINKRAQNNGYVVQISILTLDMVPVKTQDLGTCIDSVQVRSDEINQFFVTTGERLVHCVKARGNKKRIKLEYAGNSIAVLSSETFVTGDASKGVELVHL